MEKNLRKQVMMLSVIAASIFVSGNALAAASANLNQARNGTDASPTNPVNWVNGNLGGSQAHYIEGMSSPYQCVMTGITVGAQVSIIIEYDIKNSSQHAFDYLTHYNRIHPHAFSQHSNAETIDPLAGSGLAASTPFTTYPFPTPSTAGTPVAGQPAISFNTLSAATRVMTLFNGTIDTMYYVTQGNLSATQASTQLMVMYTPTNDSAVLAWGAHIASRNDWGYVGGNARSAGGISGSPFHMRLISWNYGSIGSQDRSLSGGSVTAPPAPLPVELIHFDVHALGHENIIEWTTASEINNDYFTIERSSGVSNFEAIAKVSGMGNSTVSHDYTCTDGHPISGLSYYRLVQTDYDGTSKIFGPICVQTNIRKQMLSEFKAFANVSSDNFFVSFYAPLEGDVLLEILTAEGRLVDSEMLRADEGTNFLAIRGNKMNSKGVYFVRLSHDAITTPVQKIIRN
jgi:hypothetical protein